jgi:hypothetical protein
MKTVSGFWFVKYELPVATTWVVESYKRRNSCSFSRVQSPHPQEQIQQTPSYSIAEHQIPPQA